MPATIITNTKQTLFSNFNPANFSSYYDVLGVSPNAAMEKIHEAYTKKSRLKESKTQIAKINRAYSILSSDERRQKYDAQLQEYDAQLSYSDYPQSNNSEKELFKYFLSGPNNQKYTIKQYETYKKEQKRAFLQLLWDEFNSDSRYKTEIESLFIEIGQIDYDQCTRFLITLMREYVLSVPRNAECFFLPGSASLCRLRDKLYYRNSQSMDIAEIKSHFETVENIPEQNTWFLLQNFKATPVLIDCKNICKLYAKIEKSHAQQESFRIDIHDCQRPSIAKQSMFRRPVEGTAYTFKALDSSSVTPGASAG